MILSIVLGLGLTFLPTSALSYQTYNDHRLTYGIAGQKYWIGPEAATHHGKAIPEGMALWDGDSRVNFSYSQTSVKSESRLDFTRLDETFYDGNCAVTYMYVNSSTINQMSQNWTWAKVQARALLKDTESCGAATRRPVVFSHEVGHAMGLAHANFASGGQALMHEHIAWPSHSGVTGPTWDDVNGVNFLY